MKLINKITIMLSVAFAFPIVSSADDVQVPNTAKLLYQVSGYSHIGSEAEVIDTALREVIRKETGYISTLGEEVKPIDVELLCKTAYYHWSIGSEITCRRGNGWGPGGCLNPFNQVFGTSAFINKTNYSVNVYCEPRTFDEKTVISLQRSCEQKPEASCFDERVLSAMRNVSITQRITINKPDLR